VRVINAKSSIGSGQPDANPRSNIDLKRSARGIPESIRRVRRVCENSEAKARNLPAIEPSLGFERHRLYVPAKRRPVNHSIVQQRMRAE
jgi:hypothetical protein